MKKLCYISHPYGGLEENIKDIEKIVYELYKNDDVYDNYIIISPVHTFGFMYEMYDNSEAQYLKGLSFCTDLLEHCDIMLVFGDYTTSRGCKAEIELCKKIEKDYEIVGNDIDKAINILLK